MKIIEHNGVLCTTSINIAEFTGKHHKHVIKDIERINAYLEAQIGSQPGGYFIQSTYLDANGQARKMYYLTKKGFIAFFLKGVQFVDMFKTVDFEDMLSTLLALNLYKSETTAVLYIVSNHQNLKFGISGNVESRLKTYQTLNRDAEVVFQTEPIPRSKAAKIEKAIKKNFACTGETLQPHKLEALKGFINRYL